MKKIFLIEKAWIDPMENRDAHGYKIIGFKLTEEEAKKYCKNKGYYTPNDCWSIEYIVPVKLLPKYKYNEIKILEE